MEIYMQIIWLFVLSVPVACVSWTVTHEEIFREPRDYCVNCSIKSKSLLKRKFFYLFTCEYCFSHYVVFLFLFLTRFHLLFYGWKGYLIAGFSLVWISNIYMNLYALIRQGVKKEITEIKLIEKKTEKQTKDK